MTRRRINGHFAAWFYEETYRENIDLIWPVDNPKVTAFMKSRFNIKYKSTFEFGGRVVELDNPPHGHHQVICLGVWSRHPDPTDLSFVSHECFHAAENILSKRAIPLVDDSCEAYAYLLESLVRRCLVLLDTRRKIQV